MSIETLLTLGLTAIILVVAFVIRLVALTALKLGLRLAGRDASWLRPQRVGNRTPLRPRIAAAGRGAAAGWAYARSGLTSVGRKSAAGSAYLWPRIVSGGRAIAASVAFVAAGVAAGAAAAGRTAVAGAAGLERWADATNRRLAPRTMEASATLQRALRAAGRRIAPILVTTVATLQHVATLALARTRPRGKHSLPARSRIEPRVIDLDQDEDPIGPRTTRPPAGVRL